MKNKLEKFDKQFHNKFKDFELPVSDAVLANIKKEINAGNSRKGISLWMWVLSCMLILAGASGAYYFVSNNNVKTIAKSEAIVKTEDTKIASVSQTAINVVKNDLTKKQPKTRTEQSGVIAMAQNIEPSINDKPNNQNNKAENEMDAKPIDATSTTSTSAKENTAIPMAKTSPDSKKADVEQADATNRANNNLKKEKRKSNPISAVQKNTIAQSNSDPDSGEIQMNVVETSHKMTINKKKEPARASSSESKKENKTVEKEKESLYASSNSEKQIPETNNGMRQLMSKQKKDLIRDSIVGWKTDSAKVASSLSAAVKQVEVKPIDVPKEFSKVKKLDFFVEMNGGPSFAKTIGNYSAGESHNTILKYNAGLDFGLTFNNGLSINSGIGIDAKGEQYTQSFQSGKYDTTLFTHYDSILGHPITDSSHYSNYRTINTSSSFKSSYTFLKVPFMISYCFTYKDKVFVKPSIGVTLNYLLSAKGSWSDNSGEILSYSKSNSDFNYFNWSGRFKIDVGYIIKDKYYFSIQPGMTRYFQSVYNRTFIDGSSMIVKPYSFDITFGIGYKF
jgi:hypothetical protein